MAAPGPADTLRTALRPAVRLLVRLIVSRPSLHRAARALYRRLPRRRAGPAPVPAPADPNAPYLFTPGPATDSAPQRLTVEDLYRLSRAL